jgi:hypothetical protein
MTHLDIHPVVALDVTASDAALLDTLADLLPTRDEPYVERELHETRFNPTEDERLDDGEERHLARVSFISGKITVEADDGSTTEYNGSDEAASLFAALTSEDLANAKGFIRHYRSPLGGVSPKEVREWYESNPDEQPTDESGESYVPTSFDPSNHIVDETVVE